MAVVEWVPEEMSILQQYYPCARWESLSQKLSSRSRVAIYNKARMIGLKRRVSERGFTQEELDILRTYYPFAKREFILSLLPRRSWNTIRQKASQLGLKRTEFLRKFRQEQAKSLSKKITVFCANCGKKFEKKPSQLRKHNFCSTLCCNKWKLGKPSPSKGIRRSLETRKKISEMRKGRFTGAKNHMFGKHHTPEAREKCRQARMKQEFGKPTLPEVRFIGMRFKYRLPYTYVGNGKIWINHLNPDFIHDTKKIVLEIFGSYWHDKSINSHVDLQNTEDWRREQYAQAGYELIVIWDKELTKENGAKLLGKIPI